LSDLPGQELRRGPAVTPKRPNASATRRAPRPAAPGMPTWMKVAGALGVLVAIGAAVGFGPFMRYWYTNKIDTAATLDERKSAAVSLYERHDGAAFGVFAARLNGADALARMASAEGMAQIAKEGNLNATEALSGAAAKVENADKIQLSALLGTVAHSVMSRKTQEDSPKHLTAIAKALIPELVNADAAVRGQAIEALQEVPAPGVCVALLDVATKDGDAGVKAKAADALAETALPDAAGGLLTAMASPDENLKQKATEAFVKIRNDAKSEDLLPLVTNPSDAVRHEIVAVLGKRHDPKAAEGISQALKDASPEIRKLAVKSVPVSGVAGPLNQILPLISDADEGVSIACAETLGEMRDENSKKVLLEAFAANPSGATMESLVKALGKRASGKDLAAIGVVIEQMNKHAEAFKGVSEALTMLTNSQHDLKRETERRKWTAEKWNAWWTNITSREKMREEAASLVDKAKARSKDTKSFPELTKMLHQAVDLMEKCIEMSKANDPEDVSAMETTQNEYGKIMYQFTKFQVTDKGN